MTRLEREIRTVRIMIGMHCRSRHGGKGDCESCRDLAAYAEKRIRNCPFHAEKPACRSCQIHCFKPQMKTRIKEAMRYAGPRMVCLHPILAIRHLVAIGTKRGAGQT